MASSSYGVPRNIISIGNSGTNPGYYGDTSGFETSQAGYTYGGDFGNLAQGFNGLTVGEQTSRRRQSDVDRSSRGQRGQVPYNTGLATDSLSPGATYSPQIPSASATVNYSSFQYAPAPYGPSTSGARRPSNNSKYRG